MNRQRLVTGAIASGLFVACVTGFYTLSYFLLEFDKSAAPLWPASGILLGALLLSRPERWWYWALLSFTTSTIHAEIFVPVPRYVHLQTTFIGVAQALVQASILVRWLKLRARFERLQDVSVYLVVVAAVNLFTTPLAAVAISAIRNDNLLVYMRTRWLSHTLTAMTLTPFLVTWGMAWRERPAWRWRHLLPWVALLASTLAIAWLAILPGGLLRSFLPAPYLCLLPLAAAAILFRVQGATLITFVTMLLVMFAVGRGTGWPEGNDVVTRLAHAQLFLGVIAATGLLLGTSAAEIDARTRLLRESESRYRSAMHTSAIGMAIVSLEGRWLEVNPMLCQITGYTRDELLVRNFHMLIHPDDRGSAPDRDDFPPVGIAAGDMMKRFLHKSGRMVWVHITSTIVHDEAGRPLYFVAQTQDITGRREAEAKLLAAAGRLALALRASHLGVWRHDLKMRTFEWDGRMYEIFGLPLSTEPPTEESVLQLIAEEDRPRLQQSWNEASSRESGYRAACRLRWPDGQLRHVELQGIVEANTAGRAERVIGVANDTTDIVRATMETASLKAQLQQSQKMEALGNLAAGVAHDFNTLLSGINVFVEMASTTLAPSHEATSLLKQARRGASSARALVQRILNYSRGTKLSPSATCNLVELVRDTAPLLAAVLPPNVSLSLEIQCDQARVRADPAQLQQILINLSTNAARAIGEKPGKIEIRVGLTPNSQACISVTDNGCGIDAGTRAHIFDPYFTTTKEGEGTGLGLVIVRDIVAAHSGDLEVESVVGKGSTFAVRLPLVRTTPEAAIPLVG